MPEGCRSVEFFIKVSGFPFGFHVNACYRAFYGFLKDNGRVYDYRRSRVSFIQGGNVYNRLECAPRLPLCLYSPVKLGFCKIRPSNHSPYIACLRLHRNQRRLGERFLFQCNRYKFGVRSRFYSDLYNIANSYNTGNILIFPAIRVISRIV